jgi:hypothetical protein
MKLHLALGLAILLLTGCTGEPQAESTAPVTIAPTTTAPTTTALATAIPSAEPSAEPSVEPTTDDAAVQTAPVEAITPPTGAHDADVDADPEIQYLEAFKAELVTLPDGPHVQVGTDIDAVNLGYEACEDLSFMNHADALLAYASSEERTEETVANYNAALNVAPFTLCPHQG